MMTSEAEERPRFVTGGTGVNGLNNNRVAVSPQWKRVNLMTIGNNIFSIVKVLTT